ncbi:MAG: hypothetical protein F6K26_18330, partial [Moorea sp. SIO2I5]|nr:hypothetical protein [Moorena sp. SIO2I5]
MVTTDLLTLLSRSDQNQPFNKPLNQLLTLPIACYLVAQMPLVCSAQIVPDNTLSNNSIVTATISVSNFQSNDRLDPGLGEAGDIEIVANSIELSNSGADTPNGGGITASNFSAGGGNITISANQIKTDRSTITATSELSGGGDIDITSDLLFLSNQSAISTSVNDSTGGGGDIKINSDFVVVVENSNITANAIFGPGGNILITTQGLFLSPDSQITASSEFGVDGVVNISNPDPTQNLGLVPLPATI